MIRLCYFCIHKNRSSDIRTCFSKKYTGENILNFLLCKNPFKLVGLKSGNSIPWNLAYAKLWSGKTNPMVRKSAHRCRSVNTAGSSEVRSSFHCRIALAQPCFLGQGLNYLTPFPGVLCALAVWKDRGSSLQFYKYQHLLFSRLPKIGTSNMGLFSPSTSFVGRSTTSCNPGLCRKHFVFLLAWYSVWNRASSASSSQLGGLWAGRIVKERELYLELSTEVWWCWVTWFLAAFCSSRVCLPDKWTVPFLGTQVMVCGRCLRT